MTAYYNEIDPKAAAWLRELIKHGHIAPGKVDERSILDITPADIQGYDQCHFFAGIGVWSHALRQAGWSDDKQVWTGSCPCQPFSQAGKGTGYADERHLWPAWFHLIETIRPNIVFGEQVASKAGLGWLDLVQADLEGANYASGAVDICAAGVGAPHIRQRLYFVAERVDNAASARLLGKERNTEGDSWDEARVCMLNLGREAGGLGDTKRQQPRGDSGTSTEAEGGGGMRPECDGAKPPSAVSGMANPDGERLRTGSKAASPTGYGSATNPTSGTDRHESPGPTNGYWRDADWLFCRDGKWRAVEPDTFPLVNGAPARVGRIRGYGNAIVAPVAQAFIEAYIQ